MLETVVTGLSWILIAAGSFFVVVGATGLVRMPDVFTRMHAAGILDTVGAGLMLIGMMVASGLTLVSLKLLIILAIILFTSPVATHALAQAALHAGLEPLLDSKRVLGVPERKPARRRKAPDTAKTEAVAAAEANPPDKAQPATGTGRGTSKGRDEPSNS